jgi:glycosyltransferase involved in cell wall biosynthesis
MKPHVLFLESLATIAGGQRALVDLAPALVTRFDAMALLPGEGALADALRACGVRVLFAPMASYTLVEKNWRDVLNAAAETPRLALLLARLIRARDVKVVYANSSRAFVWGTLGAWLARRPILWHAHNILADAKSRALVALAARLPNVRAIICASDGAAAQFARKTIVIPIGVDLERFAPSPEMRAAKRAELGIAPDAPVIGIIGDLIPLKGQDVFIRAATQVAQRVSNVTSLIVGDTRPNAEGLRWKSSLESAIRDSQSAIRMLGFQSDIAALINALDILVVASTTETGPLVLLQSLACGVPVVSTPVGRALELLGDGACGALFPIGDADALAEKLGALIARPDTRAAMRRAARERASRFSLDVWRSRMVDEIEKVLA